MSERFGIAPWQVTDLTVGEMNKMVRVLQEEERENRKAR